MMSRFNILHFVAGTLFVFALLFLFYSTRAMLSTGIMLAAGEITRGKVIRVEGRQAPGPLRRPARTYCPRVRFQDASGPREFLAECQSPPLAREGESVRVLFTARSARIYGVWNTFLRNLVSLGAGLVLLAGAVVVYKRANRARAHESAVPPT